MNYHLGDESERHLRDIRNAPALDNPLHHLVQQTKAKSHKVFPNSTERKEHREKEAAVILFYSYA